MFFYIADKKYFRDHFYKHALSDALIEMTIPDKPNSRLQKYKLTTIGSKIKTQKITNPNGNNKITKRS